LKLSFVTTIKEACNAQVQISFVMLACCTLLGGVTISLRRQSRLFAPCTHPLTPSWTGRTNRVQVFVVTDQESNLAHQLWWRMVNQLYCT